MGWSLLTVKTEANRDSLSTYERGPSLVGLLGLSCTAGTREFCPALAALVGPVANILPNTILLHLSPSPRKLGRH